MRVPFTPQLLGDLIEKGYTHMLASTAFESAAADMPVVLKPVKLQPVLPNLPQGYQTYYKITREPLQMVCGMDGVDIFLEYETGTENASGNNIYNDSYFRMSEDYFRQVLDSLEDYAIFTTDTNGNVNSWNTGAQKVLGYEEQEILGVSAEVFFTPEDREKGVPKQELSSALKDGRAIDERFHLCKDGTRFWGSGLVFPLHDESREHRGFTKIMRNLGEEEDARREQEAK